MKKKIDPIVIKETNYIAIWVMIFSAALQAIFLIIGQWDYTILLGNLLSGTIGILNFLFMGIAIQNALQKEEKEAKQMIKTSGTLRNFFLFVVTVIGVLLPCFHFLAVIIPLFFPRVAIAIRPLFEKRAKAKEKSDHER